MRADAAPRVKKVQKRTPITPVVAPVENPQVDLPAGATPEEAWRSLHAEFTRTQAEVIITRAELAQARAEMQTLNVRMGSVEMVQGEVFRHLTEYSRGMEECMVEIKGMMEKLVGKGEEGEAMHTD